MTFSHNRDDMIRSVLEGVVFEIRNMLEEVEATTCNPGKLCRISGGGSGSPLWNQIQADIYGKPTETVMTSEATSLGAAMCAAVGLGIYKDIREAADAMVRVKDHWDPDPINVELYNELFVHFKNAYGALGGKFFDGLAEFQAKHA